MRSKYISRHLIGWSFGLMTAASWHSYHTYLAGGLAFAFLIGGFFTADFSGPNDPT